MRPTHGGPFIRGLHYGLLLAAPAWTAVALVVWAAWGGR